MIQNKLLRIPTRRWEKVRGIGDARFVLGRGGTRLLLSAVMSVSLSLRRYVVHRAD